MSCMYLEAQDIYNTICRVANIYDNSKNNYNLNGELRYAIADKIIDRKRLPKLIRAVCRLNHNAYNVRYRYEDKGFVFPELDFSTYFWINPKFHTGTHKDLAQVIYSLEFITYQCSEGGCTDKNIFKLLRAIIADLKNYYFYFRSSPSTETIFDPLHWAAV